MKLLIVTQKADVDDPILGFFMRWIDEFAKRTAQVTVICLERGRGEIPPNVRVRSLGKETSASRLTYLARFFRYIWEERANYDAVFVHMNPIYAVLGGLLWRLLGKKVGLWYTHKSVDWKLRIAVLLVNRIFTASRESFRLRSSKVLITGHGIDTSLFKPLPSRQPSGEFLVLSVGRIARVKKHETAVLMAEAMKRFAVSVKLLIIGRPVLSEDEEYLKRLKEYVERRGLADMVSFLPSMPNREIAAYFQKADILVNASETGSLDKVVLEAMSAGLVPVTSNEAYKPILSPFGLFIGKEDAGEMERIAERLAEGEKRRALGMRLREIVVKEHNLETLAGKIIAAYEKTA